MQIVGYQNGNQGSLNHAKPASSGYTGPDWLGIGTIQPWISARMPKSSKTHLNWTETVWLDTRTMRFNRFSQVRVQTRSFIIAGDGVFIFNVTKSLLSSQFNKNI